MLNNNNDNNNNTYVRMYIYTGNYCQKTYFTVKYYNNNRYKI